MDLTNWKGRVTLTRGDEKEFERTEGRHCQTHMKANSPFYDRLDQAVKVVTKSLEESNVVLAPGESLDKLNVAIAYGETHTWQFALTAYKGKNTRRGLTVVIYRTESGRYELTYYYL